MYLVHKILPGNRLMPSTSLSFGRVSLLLPHGTEVSLAIGHRIWPSSFVLCQHLSDRTDLKDALVLDLGSGTGLASLMALKCGARCVWMQDLPGEEEIYRMQRRMMEANGIGGERYRRLELRWGNLLPADDLGFDLIISSDTFYEPSEFEALLSTVAGFLGKSPSARFITAYHDRDAEYYIGGVLRLWGLQARILEPTPVVPETVIESVKAMRNPADPEEWPLRLASTVHLIEIFRM